MIVLGTEENVKPDGTPEEDEDPKKAGETLPGGEAPGHADDYPRGASTWPVPGALNHLSGVRWYQDRVSPIITMMP